MAVKKVDKYLNNNESLPVNITIDYTPEQAIEFKKCAEDIIYFAQNYFHIVNLDAGRQTIKLFDAQKDAILDILKNKRTIICASRQIGKRLHVDTPVPSPNGWTTMGELKDGDIIFDWNGNPTKVVKAHDILDNRECFKITFSNGEEIIADAEHEWFTQSRIERRKGCDGSVKTTKQLLDTLLCGKKIQEPNHRIPFKHKVQYKEKELSIEPYLFGKSLNVYKKNHIPDIYLQSSEQQRLCLLQGLMDSDGYINSKGTAQFYSIKKKMAENVIELLASLGIQSSLTTKIPTIRGKKCNRVYIVTFKTDLPIFRLKRKYKKINKTKITRNDFIYIKNIERIDSVPTRCITVDNPDQMYLVGKTFIPTHNTTLMTIVCLWNVIFKKDYQVAILANKEDQAKEILERIKLAYEELPNWLKAGVSEFTKENLRLVNGSKIFVSTTSESGIRGKSVNLLFVDEFAHIAPQIADPFFKSVMPTISSSKSAKIVLISTPKGAEGKFYEIFRDAEKKKNGWCAVKIHYSQVPGRDAAWIKEQQASINYDMDTWKQEFEIEFLENGIAALNQAIIDRMKSETCPAELSFDEGEYFVWKQPEPNKIYTIGVDVAEGVGQDFTVATVLDITDLNNIEQTAIFASNKIQPWIFAEKLNQIARSWGRPFLCVERNKEGGQVIDALLNVHDYNNLVTFSMKNDKRNVYQSPGIFCHQNSKYTGIQNMKYFIETKQSVKIYDINTVKEFETFIRKINKTWGAKKGFKDDRIMALVWALVLLEKDIAEKYLDIIEYDEAGKPSVILDPNQHLANLNFHNLLNDNKPIRNIGGGKEFSIFFNYEEKTKVNLPEKYASMLYEPTWEFL